MISPSRAARYPRVPSSETDMPWVLNCHCPSGVGVRGFERSTAVVCPVLIEVG